MKKLSGQNKKEYFHFSWCNLPMYNSAICKHWYIWLTRPIGIKMLYFHTGYWCTKTINISYKQVLTIYLRNIFYQIFRSLNSQYTLLSILSLFAWSMMYTPYTLHIMCWSFLQKPFFVWMSNATTSEKSYFRWWYSL